METIMKWMSVLMLFACFFAFAQEEAPPEDGATVIAEFTSTPAGTQYRTSEFANWGTAKVGIKLYLNYESRNTSQSTYAVELQPDGQVDFPDSITTVTAGSYSGTAEYLNSQQTWVEIPENQAVSAYSVRTSKDAILPLSIESSRGMFKPKGWGGSD